MSAKDGVAASSSSKGATKARPKVSKDPKKKKDPDASAPEKRGAIFKKKCPKNIQDRVSRVFAQR